MRSLLPGSVDLLVYPTRKFKTTVVSILLHRHLDEGSSAAALVPYLLRRGMVGHPDMASISRELERLFGASLDVDVVRFGERQILALRLDVVNDRYLLMGGRDLLKKGLGLLRDLMLRPVLENDEFPVDVFEQERTNLRRFVDGMVNDRGRYALDRCIRMMCEGEAYSRYEYGEAEEIEALTTADVTASWRDILATAPLEIYVVGHAEPDAVRDMTCDLFGSIRDGESVRRPPDATRRCPKKIRRVRETADVVQSRLVMGYRFDVGYEDRLSLPLGIWNIVFGGGSFSRLFRHVRERHSLAYYCSSSMDQAKGVGFVQAGIEGDQADRVERIIRRQLSELRRGKIELEELRAAKAYLKSAVRAITDSPARMIGFFQEQRAAGTNGSFAEVLDRIGRVKRRDLCRASESLALDTVYLLTKDGN